MGLFKRLDYWSIMDELEEIIEGKLNDCFRNSEYADYYDELLLELANIAGDFWNECDSIKNSIYNHDIPLKMRKYATEDDNTEYAAFWFNTVVLTLSETDISQLFWREENYGDCEQERAKRVNMLDRLSKKDLVWLVTTICNLIVRFMELDCAWQAVKGTIDELDSRQAFVKNGDVLEAPKSGFL